MLRFFYDPKTEPLVQQVESRHPGFIDILDIVLINRKLNCSLKEQFIDAIDVITGENARAYIDVTETRSNGKKKCVRIILSLRDNFWTYGRWSHATEIFVYSGREKVNI